MSLDGFVPSTDATVVAKGVAVASNGPVPWRANRFGFGPLSIGSGG